MPTVEMVTTAPEAYDGFGTVTLARTAYQDAAGNRYRRVAMVPEHTAWQIARYRSGMFAALTPADLEEWIADGFARPVAQQP